MSNNPDWKSKLQRHIDRHARRSANGGGPGSIAVSSFLIFGQLRRMGFQLDPTNIRGTHIQHLLWYWTCDHRIEQLCRQREVELLPRPYSARYIQSLMADLRAYCDWVGKPGMVLPMHRDLAEPGQDARPAARGASEHRNPIEGD